jgi:parallel beta-helix repeat protein
MARRRTLLLAALLTTPLFAAAPAHAAVVCGKTITHDTTLTQDLANCPGDGLKIGKSGISVNLNGHDITAGMTVTPGSAGIRLDGRKSVKIEGQGTGLSPGEVKGFDTGVSLDNADKSKVEDVNADANGTGISLANGANGNRIKFNSANNEDGTGIFVSNSDGNRIKSNTADQSQNNGLTLVNSDNNKIKLNNFNDNDQIGGDGSGGIVLLGSNGNLIDTNSASLNGSGEASGIYVQGKNNIVSNNDALTNGHDGIHIQSGTGDVVSGNTASSNGTDSPHDGIQVDVAGTVIKDNTADSNTDNGIDAVSGVVDGGGNTATGNTSTNCVNVACP